MPRESEYIQRILSGDADAFRYFVREYQSYAYTLAFRIVRRPEEAEEVVQDAFLKAFRALGHFKQQSKFSTWFYPIVTRQALSHVRKRKMPLVDIAMAAQQADESEDAARLVKTTERKVMIEQILDQMKPKERLVLQLHYLEEQSIEEIVSISGFSKSNVKVLLHRGRKSFEQLLPAPWYEDLML
ncbi:MAG: sigma-70 family RNA polymerase sigma factor [Bacteroidota bacterium]